MHDHAPSHRVVRPLGAGATFEVDLIDVGGVALVEKRIARQRMGLLQLRAALMCEADFLQAMAEVALPFLPRLVALADDRCSLRETFVPGEHLGDALERRPAPADRATLLLALVRAVARLHAAGASSGPLGAFHGDLSLTNVLVDAAGRVGLVDFGASGTSSGGGLRVYGRPLGTVPYAAPERVRGQAWDHQGSDRYALAVIAIEALTPGLAVAGAPSTRVRQLPEAARVLAIGDRGVAPTPHPDGAMRPIVHLLADMVAFREADRPPDLDALEAALFSLAPRA